MKILNFISMDATLSMPVSTYEVLLEKVVLDERERIIKLLEDPKNMNRWLANWDTNLGVYGNVQNYFLALIKGEQV